jgi:hypothetical protein
MLNLVENKEIDVFKRSLQAKCPQIGALQALTPHGNTQ